MSMMSTARNLTLAAAGLLSTLGFTGCYYGTTRPSGYYSQPGGQVYARGSVSVGNPGYYYPTTAAPDPIYEDIGAAPGYGWVWIDGYWNWSGYEWQWIPGHWEEPRPNYVYVQPYYSYDSGSYLYVPGYWEVRDRIPNYIRVRDHRDGRPTTGYYDGGGGRYTVPSRTRDHRGYHPVQTQPPNNGRYVIPSQTSPNYGPAPQQPGRRVIPSTTSPNTYQPPAAPSQPGRTVIPSGPSPSYSPPPAAPAPSAPGRTVIPSGPSPSYSPPPAAPPPSAPGRTVIPSGPGQGYYAPPRPAPGRTVIPSAPGAYEAPPPSGPPPGRAVIPSGAPPQQAPPPPSGGRAVIPSGPPAGQPPPAAPPPPQNAPPRGYYPRTDGGGPGRINSEVVRPDGPNYGGPGGRSPYADRDNRPSPPPSNNQQSKPRVRDHR